MMESAKTLKSYYKYAQYAEGVNGNMNIIHKESIKKSPNGTQKITIYETKITLDLLNSSLDTTKETLNTENIAIETIQTEAQRGRKRTDFAASYEVRNLPSNVKTYKKEQNI